MQAETNIPHKLKKSISILLCLLILSCASYASQKPNFSAGTKYARLFSVAANELLQEGANGYPVFDLAIGFNRHPSDSSDFARAFNYPVAGVGVSAALLNTMKTRRDAYLGNMFNAYLFMDWDLLRAGTFALGVKGHVGVGYNNGTYNPKDNPNNDFMGNKIMMYYGFGPYAKFHVADKWEVGASAMIWHHSNSRMNLPNMGLNEWGVEFFARYYLEKPYLGNRKVNPVRPYGKKILWDVYAGGAPYVSDAIYFAYLKDNTREWPFKPQARFLVGGDVMYKYCYVAASGIALDLIYSTGNDRLKEADISRFGKADPAGYSPFFAGISFVQEIYFGNISMRATIGAHIGRRLGTGEALDKPTIWFQSLGGRYYFRKLGNTFIGFDSKVRYFSRADNFALVVGKRF